MLKPVIPLEGGGGGGEGEGWNGMWQGGKHKHEHQNSPFSCACVYGFVYAATSENQIPLRHNTSARIFTTPQWLCLANENTGCRLLRA